MNKADKHVYKRYNLITDWFDQHRNRDLIEKAYLDCIIQHIPQNGAILDVGCGMGEPIAQFFIEKHYSLVGVDASEKMIAYCRQRFPENSWIQADMRELNIKKEFNAVIAWHSLFHLDSEDQRSTLALLAQYVKPNGLLVFTSGIDHGETWSDNGGQMLYHASLSAQAYRDILKAHGFTILLHNIKDPQCGEATVWIAQKIILK